MKGGEWTPHRKSDEPRLADLAISDWGPAGANAEVDAARGLDDLSRLFPHKSKAHLPKERTSKTRTSKDPQV